MIVVPPQPLLGHVSITGASDPTALWNPGTTYAANALVTDANHARIHKSVAGSNTGNPPPIDGTSTAFWTDVGPTNITQMIDYTTNKQTIADSTNLSILIASFGFRVDTIGVTGIDADSVTLTVTGLSGAIYSKTETLFSRVVSNWYDYFYKPFVFRTAALFPSLPSNLSYNYTLALSTGGRVVKCGAVVAGQSVYLGTIQYSPTITGTNYSTMVRDNFGNATLIPRRTVPTNDVICDLPANLTDQALAAKNTLNAVPALWAGLSDDTQPYFGALLVFGFYTTFDIVADRIDYSTLTLEIQGY